MTKTANYWKITLQLNLLSLLIFYFLVIINLNLLKLIFTRSLNNDEPIPP